MQKRLPLAVLLAAVTLVGCGGSPTSTKAKSRSSLADAAPTVPQPVAGGQPVNQDLAPMLTAVQQASQGAGFTATVEIFDKGPKDSDTQTLKVAYKKPSTLKIHIVTSSGDSKDAKVLWTGGSDMKVKPSYLPFSVSLGIADSKVVTRNGWTIKDTAPSGILNVLLDPAAQRTALGDNLVGGKTLTLVQVKSAKSPKGATHEVIGVDPTTCLPAFREVYKDQTVLYRFAIKSIKIGVPAASDLEI